MTSRYDQTLQAKYQVFRYYKSQFYTTYGYSEHRHSFYPTFTKLEYLWVLPLVNIVSIQYPTHYPHTPNSIHANPMRDCYMWCLISQTWSAIYLYMSHVKLWLKLRLLGIPFLLPPGPKFPDSIVWFCMSELLNHTAICLIFVAHFAFIVNLLSYQDILSRNSIPWLF